MILGVKNILEKSGKQKREALNYVTSFGTLEMTIRVCFFSEMRINY